MQEPHDEQKIQKLKIGPAYAFYAFWSVLLSWFISLQARKT